MKAKLDKILAIITVLVLVGLVSEGIYIYSHWPREKSFRGREKVNSSELEKPYTKEPINQKTEINKETPLPESVDLDIPFITQAPFRSWKKYPFNHTCEEAVVLQIHYYFEKKQVEESKIYEELLALVDFQIKNYGSHEDTSATQTAKLIEDYYGYKTKVSYDISLEDIKKEIAQGYPVIVPTAGRLLGNPHFTPPGPLYHMLVIKGYNPKEFITNDPGTYRTGANWPYSYETLEKAIHDWNEGDVLNGRPAMIVVSPPQEND